MELHLSLFNHKLLLDKFFLLILNILKSFYVSSEKESTKMSVDAGIFLIKINEFEKKNQNFDNHFQNILKVYKYGKIYPNVLIIKSNNLSIINDTNFQFCPLYTQTY